MEQFNQQFDSYVNTIIEVLSRKVAHQNHAFDADTIRGRSIEDLKDLIREALNDHINDKKAHNLSYSDIGAMSRSNILGRFGNRQNATLVPISYVENLTDKMTFNWTDKRVTIQPFDYIFNGLSYTYPGGSVSIQFEGVSYLVITPIDALSTVGEILNTNDGAVSLKRMHLVRINTNTNHVASMRMVKLGGHHLSRAGSGGGLAVSNGLIYRIDSLDSGWK